MRTAHNIIFLLLILLFLSATTTFGCSCGQGSDSRSARDIWIGSINGSAAVFSGKVVGFEFRKGITVDYAEEQKQKHPKLTYETKVIKFQVDRWWKAGLSPTVEILTNETKGSDGFGTSSGCDYNFTKGETYIVFASGSSSALRTSSCSRTTSTKVAWYSEILDLIGPGTAPDSPEK
ncbi:MAG: hypothetical protein QM785_12135 [Pyrinomonadaceae bacterium]